MKITTDTKNSVLQQNDKSKTNTTNKSNEEVSNSVFDMGNVADLDISEKVTTIGGSLNKTLTHTDLVKGVLDSGVPEGTKVYAVNGDLSLNQLNALKVGTVNISKGPIITYESLSNLLGKQITPENLAENKTLIKQAIKDNAQTFENNQNPTYDDKVFYCTQEGINRIEDYIKSGKKVFIAAGNSGKEAFNGYTLADGAEVVGATDAVGNPASYSSENSLITQHAPGNVGLDKDADGKTIKLLIDGVPTKAKLDASFKNSSIADSVIGKTIDEIKQNPDLDVVDKHDGQYIVIDKNTRKYQIFSKSIGGNLTISDGVSSNIQDMVDGTSFASPNAAANSVRIDSLIKHAVEERLKNNN